MNAFSCALFDLDGTLLDTLDDLTDATNYALEQFGFPTRTRQEVRSYVGNGAATQIRRSAPDADDAQHARMLAVYKDRYSHHNTDKTAPFPGIMDMLAELKRQGIPCAVVSNKYESAARKVCAAGLGAFPEVVIGEREGMAKKPDPAGCVLAMDMLGVTDRANAVYIGDSDVDAKTAANAGLHCLLVSWGFRDRDVLEKTGACVCDTPAELLERILGGNDK